MHIFALFGGVDFWMVGVDIVTRPGGFWAQKPPIRPGKIPRRPPGFGGVSRGSFFTRARATGVSGPSSELGPFFLYSVFSLKVRVCVCAAAITAKPDVVRRTPCPALGGYGGTGSVLIYGGI